jgi:hypothetical protein
VLQTKTVKRICTETLVQTNHCDAGYNLYVDGKTTDNHERHRLEAKLVAPSLTYPVSCVFHAIR